MAVIKLEYLAGTDFRDCLTDARRIMGILGCYVEMMFNGVKVTVMGSDLDPDDALELVLKTMGEEHKFTIIH